MGCGISIQRPCHSRDCRTDAQDLHRFPTALAPTSDNLTLVDDSLVPCKRISNGIIDNLEEIGTISVYEDENCIICVEHFDEKDHRPVLLPCGHMLCFTCITELDRKKDDQCIVCPTDRQAHFITSFQLKEKEIIEKDNEHCEQQCIGSE